MPRGLGENARVLLDLVLNTDPARAGTLSERLPAASREQLNSLSPGKQNLDCLTARLLIVHGARDNKLPLIDSQALAERFPDGQNRLFILESLAHTQYNLSALVWHEFLPVVEAVLAQERRRSSIEPKAECQGWT